MSDATADRLAIHELLAHFGHLFDDLAYDRYDELFTEDVVFDMSGYGEENLVSPAQIAARFRGQISYGHISTNVVVDDLSADSATVRSKYIAFGNDGSINTGDYLDTVVRTPAGWRISYRRAARRQPGRAGEVYVTKLPDLRDPARKDTVQAP